GDKNGLLSAVVDYGFDRYLDTKRAATPSEDPVADLRSGWDSHVAFAQAHPAVYRLMFSPTLGKIPNAPKEAFDLLLQVLDRCAAAGRLRTEPQVAAEAIMSANIGVALSLVSQPDIYLDPNLSTRVRDAVHAVLLTKSPSRGTKRVGNPDLGTAAAQLAALVRNSGATALTSAETALLLQWLSVLATGGGPDKPVST
ncbi:MAG: WHG domain-containing protein, partial [Mycobacterium sp.]|nr:WHG domain-containing protein [Mycobacterium sp.]